VSTAARELEVRVRPWDREKDAVVAFVVGETPDLRETKAVAIEADELV
jgi:hypothetical protein